MGVVLDKVCGYPAQRSRSRYYTPSPLHCTRVRGQPCLDHPRDPLWCV